VDFSHSERAIAVGIGQRLRSLLRVDQHEKLASLLAPFVGPTPAGAPFVGATSADEANTRGNFFELRLLNSLSDLDLQGIELDHRPPGLSTNNNVDLFCPGRQLAVEAQCNRTIQVPSFQIGSNRVSHQRIQSIVHEHVYATTDVAEDQAQSLLAMVNSKCASKHFDQLTAPVWLITEIFEGDYFRNFTSASEHDHQTRLCWYFLRDAANAPRVPLRGVHESKWPQNVLEKCPYVRFAFSEYAESDRLTHLYVIPRTEADRHGSADLHAALGVSVEVLNAQ